MECTCVDFRWLYRMRLLLNGSMGSLVDFANPRMTSPS
jgi:hypothetical protein